MHVVHRRYVQVDTSCVVCGWVKVWWVEMEGNFFLATNAHVRRTYPGCTTRLHNAHRVHTRRCSLRAYRRPWSRKSTWSPSVASRLHAQPHADQMLMLRSTNPQPAPHGAKQEAHRLHRRGPLAWGASRLAPLKREAPFSLLQWGHWGGDTLAWHRQNTIDSSHTWRPNFTAANRPIRFVLDRHR